MEKRFSYTTTNPYLFAGLCAGFILLTVAVFGFGVGRDAVATICGGVGVYLLGQVKVNGRGLFS